MEHFWRIRIGRKEGNLLPPYPPLLHRSCNGQLKQISNTNLLLFFDTRTSFRTILRIIKNMKTIPTYQWTPAENNDTVFDDKKLLPEEESPIGVTIEEIQQLSALLA